MTAFQLLITKTQIFFSALILLLKLVGTSQKNRDFFFFTMGKSVQGLA